MIERGLSAFRNKRVLLLQGPVGPFFSRLAQDLTKTGAKVTKINLNGGDWLFYRRNSIAFRGTIDEWPAFLKDVLDRHQIDTIMLFGDCRAYHGVAHNIARLRNIEVGVFEEGYVRPDYVTLERDGVNGYSRLPDDPAYYLDKIPAPSFRAEPVGKTFWYAGMWACLYYLAAQILKPLFPHYRHHRPLTVLEAGPWLRALWRKLFYAVKEHGLQARLTGPLSKKFFIVPLQVHNDAQLHVHSEFQSIEEFIRHVTTSFVNHAPDDTVLVIKHHPMDRGYSDYSKLISHLAREFQLGMRLLYVHDLRLPRLLDHSCGTVVINSTVGLSALFHKCPLKVCGSSIYNIKGLTFQGSVDEFWGAAKDVEVDYNLFQRFRSYIINRTQLNGSFYKRLPLPGSFAGIRWEEREPLHVEEQAQPAFGENVYAAQQDSRELQQSSVSIRAVSN